MTIKRVCQEIKEAYKPHGVKMDIESVGFIEKHRRAILQVDLKKGATIRRFFNRAQDVRHALHLEMFYPFKEGSELYLAVSDKQSVTIDLIEILQNSASDMRGLIAPYAVGETIRGDPYLVDICKLPHLIIAGASNTGKSAALRSLILSTACTRSVDDVIIFLIDTGANSLSSVFGNLPHLGYKPVKDKIEAARIFLFLEWLLDDRLNSNEDAARIFPPVLCVVDESTSLIRGIRDKELSKTVINAIETIFQRGRHAGIHMIWATQDPTFKSTHIDFGSVESRMSFSYSQYQQSMAILGSPGAEKLTEKGSMLFIPPECQDPVHLQGSYISPEDAKELTAKISALPQNRTNQYRLNERELSDFFDGTDMIGNRSQPRQQQRNGELCDIVLWSLGQKQVSRSKIMKTFRMSKRANEIFRTLDELGIIDDKQPSYQPRAVIPQCVADLSDEAWEFFNNNEIPEYEIRAAFGERPEPNLDYSDTDDASSTPASAVLNRHPHSIKNGKIVTDSSSSPLKDILDNLH